ncbi:hypothetical protein EYF80_015238 [Liparis tanakae]|uniref:Uncharacterized protein n=1 Tax=Liparis tanakae TaxID=230148 RepID=A0A4Z2I923_9TELE|nr:hypothetical protein EYF80_015238 [Liparis tanakae]
MQTRLLGATSTRLRWERRGGSEHISRRCSAELNRRWPSSLIQVLSQPTAQSQRHGFSGVILQRDLAPPTCDTEHLQAHEWREGRGPQGAEVIPAEVQQGQGGQARQSLVRQQLDAVLLQDPQVLQTPKHVRGDQVDEVAVEGQLQQLPLAEECPGLQRRYAVVLKVEVMEAVEASQVLKTDLHDGVVLEEDGLQRGGRGESN